MRKLAGLHAGQSFGLADGELAVIQHADNPVKHEQEKPEAHCEGEEGSGNVFADLGLEDADELFTRAQMGFHIYTILKDKKLKQRGITCSVRRDALMTFPPRSC